MVANGAPEKLLADAEFSARRRDELRDAVAKIGTGELLAAGDARVQCWRCREPIDGEVASIPTTLGGTRTLHPTCWEIIREERAREREAQREAAIAARMKHVSDRFDYYSAGHVLGRDGHRLCHPPSWSYARFDNPEFRRRASKKIVAAVERWDPEKVPTLLLAAPTGRGKTGATLAWLYRHREQQLELAKAGDEKAHIASFMFVTGPELAVARRNSELGSESPLITHALDIGLLILDELGFEKLTEVPFEIIDHRYRKQMVTVVTTGLRPAEFRARYGDAMYRRLAEPGAVVEDFPVG